MARMGIERPIAGFLRNKLVRKAMLVGRRGQIGAGRSKGAWLNPGGKAKGKGKGPTLEQVLADISGAGNSNTGGNDWA